MTINSSISYFVETRHSDACVQVGNNEIMSSSYVKLLGVYFDQKLIFDYHVEELCRKAGRKLSVRLTNTLDVGSKNSSFSYLYIVTS